VRSRKHGFGVYYYKNGVRYEGEFVQDERDGHGILYEKDGTVQYDGGWADVRAVVPLS